MQSVPSLCSLNGHKGAVLCCCVHQGLLITAGHDKKIIVWDAANNTIKLEISAHDHIINGLDMCVDGPNATPCVLSASWDKTVKVWDLNSGELISTFTGHNNRVKTVKALPNFSQTQSSPTNRTKVVSSATAASGDDDGHIYVWDIHSAQALLFLDEHNRFIVSLAAYIDNSGIVCLVSASADASIRLWDVSDIIQADPTPHNANATAGKLSKTPTSSSICVIKTPSKYISSLCTAPICAAAPLITGFDASCVTKTALPPISPARKHITTAGTTTVTANSTANAINTNTGSNTAETIILAADTLGSIYIYRAKTGALLVRLETACKIVTLFTTPDVLNVPYFPNEEDIHSYYTGTSGGNVGGTVGSGNTGNSGIAGGAGASRGADCSLYITPERDALLVQNAIMKRQHYIASKVSHRNSPGSGSGSGASSGAGSGAGGVDNPLHGGAKCVYYVPDNGSVGCFCLQPDMYVHHTSSTSGTSSCSSVDVTSSISLTHTVKLDLCRAMSALVTTSTASTTSSSAAEPKRRKSIDLNIDNMSIGKREGSGGGAERRVLTHSVTEPTSGNAKINVKKSNTTSSIANNTPNIVYDNEGGSGNSSICVSASNSTKSNTSTKVLQAFNSSAVPNTAKSKATANSKNTTNVNSNSGASTGGVMSVSINTTDTANLLLQCFAMTTTSNTNTTTTHTNRTNTNLTHFMVLGGRDSLLFNCPFNPQHTTKTLKVPSVHSEQDNKTHFLRPTPIILPRPGMLMTDILTPTVSPLHKDCSESSGINATISTSRSSNSSNGSPAHSPHKPHTPHTPHTPHLHSPKKSDIHSSHYGESPLGSPARGGDSHKSNSSNRSDRSDGGRGGGSRGSSKGVGVSVGVSVGVGGGSDGLSSPTNRAFGGAMPTVPTAYVNNDTQHAYPSTATSTSATTNTTTTNTTTNIHTSSTIQEGDDGADLEDEMSLSEVSHIHHYYDDLLHGRITQRPADDTMGNNKSAKNKTHLSSMLRVHGAINKDFESGAEVKTEYGEAVYEGSMLEYLHMLDNKDNNVVSLGTHNPHPTTASTTNNTNTNTANTNTTTNSGGASVSGYASIVSNSTMNSNFWEAANTALNKYSFRRIRLQSKPHTTHTTHTTHSARTAYSTGADASASSTGITLSSVVIYPGNNTSANNTMVHSSSDTAVEHTHRALKPKLHTHVHNAHTHANTHTNSNHSIHHASNHINSNVNSHINSTNVHNVHSTNSTHVPPVHTLHTTTTPHLHSTHSVQHSRSERLKPIQNSL